MICANVPDAAMLPSSSPVPGEQGSRRGYVVIAEDQEETRAYLCHVLERAGFSVDALADGRAALSTCQLRAPDVLECHMVAGGFDYLVKARVKDMAAYREFLGKTLLQKGVRETHTYAVMEEVKNTSKLPIK